METLGVANPFRRTFLQFVDGEYTEGGRARYVNHPDFAQHPEHYVRAYLVLQKDLLALFDYIEPAEANLTAYSFRIHELLMRACIEVEANFKAILLENGYKKTGNWTMRDYAKVESSHYLSQYRAKLPVWRGAGSTLAPFADFGSLSSPSWYRAYNAAKHDRHENFPQANLESVLSAMAGLVVLLSAQFGSEDFSPNSGYLMLQGTHDGFDNAIGKYFRIAWPCEVPEGNRYNFNWQTLKTTQNPIRSFNYQSAKAAVSISPT